MVYIRVCCLRFRDWLLGMGGGGGADGLMISGESSSFEGMGKWVYSVFPWDF